MKKTIIPFAGMFTAVIAVPLLSRISSLNALPETSPADFLASMPYWKIYLFNTERILIQPSSTFFVYFLGIIMIAAGIYFLVSRDNKKSRYLWGIGLVLWGISAIAAGTSYQAFGYELKCRGRDICLFTSDFELVYMLLTAYSINYLAAATGYTSLGESGRGRLIIFAVADSIIYTFYLLTGAIIPVRFLISYFGFITFIGPNFILMFILNIRHYLKFRDRLNKRLIGIWIGFLVVNAGYFIALFSGFPSFLFDNYGIWFNENDVLHVLLILWTVQIFAFLRKSLKDL
ncbi:MAG: hypothetical protein JXR86_05155 [Spirochaetales bacterium]|nr:hypothetical protein [Spirochaetales bacterium]